MYVMGQPRTSAYSILHQRRVRLHTQFLRYPVRSPVANIIPQFSAYKTPSLRICTQRDHTYWYFTSICSFKGLLR